VAAETLRARVTRERRLTPQDSAALGADVAEALRCAHGMGGGHLSLQVHPLTACIRERFGIAYAQDESDDLMDAGPDASVFLGLREDVNPQAMPAALDAGGAAVPSQRLTNGELAVFVKDVPSN